MLLKLALFGVVMLVAIIAAYAYYSKFFTLKPFTKEQRAAHQRLREQRIIQDRVEYENLPLEEKFKLLERRVASLEFWNTTDYPTRRY